MILDDEKNKLKAEQFSHKFLFSKTLHLHKSSQRDKRKFHGGLSNVMIWK